jgi:hypothetical protein
MRGVQSLSAITAALRDEEEDSDDGGPMDEDTALEDVDNPRWQLYETIKTTTNNQGAIRFLLSIVHIKGLPQYLACNVMTLQLIYGETLLYQSFEN